ncbi:hypothetical protein PINS_up012825 [Pythium insidiosum]|nr:hypothetical protein PINS_up012825 [Pythium insidiosum]
MPTSSASLSSFLSPPHGAAVSPAVFRWIWGVVLLVHLVCAAYAAVVAALYLYVPVHAPELVENAELYSVSIPARYYPLVATLFLAVAAWHLAVVLKALSTSWQQGRPQWPAPSNWGLLRCLRVRRRCLRRRWCGLRRAWHWLLAFVSAFDVTDPNYDTTHVVRELVETAFQSVQTYRSSYLVARPWMNHALVALLVLNCWATPAVQRAGVHRDVAEARLLGLAVNVALAFASYVVLPVVLFLPYYALYSDATGTFPHRFWYTDRWLVRLVNEWQLLLVTSWSDGVAKLFIATALTRSLLAVSKLVQPVERQRVSPADDEACKPRLEKQTQTQSAVPPLHRRSTIIRRPSRVDAFGRRALLLWGAIVLIVHVHTALHRHNERCMEQVRPWFSRGAACSLMEINCQRNAQRGDALEFDRALASVERRWLSFLVVRHCGHVEITPALLELSNLVGLKVYNSTIARWGDDAALSGRRHPRLAFVLLVATNMTALPRGLYGADFPQHLKDLEICRSNLSSLPDDVARAWPERLFLLLEELRLPSFPAVVSRLGVESLSVASNGFTSVPAEFFEDPRLNWLKINGNPIAALPISVRRAPTIRWLRFQRTDIATLPEWIDARALFDAEGGDSPLCDALSVQPEETLTPRQRELRRVVDCAPPTQLTHYPVEDEPFNNP